jgi:hypothetical protein
MDSTENNDKEKRPNIKPGAVRDTIDHSGITEILHMNKYHFLLILEKYQDQKPKAPRFEHVMIPFGILLTTLIPFFTSDFRDTLGLSANIWQSLTLMILILSLVTTIVLSALCLKNQLGYKQKSSEDICNEVIKQMEAEHQQYEKIVQK